MLRKNLQHIALKIPTIIQNPIEKSPPFIIKGINIKTHYSKTDIENLEHLNFAAGISPYLRGPYSTMYIENPWTIKQYQKNLNAENIDTFYKESILKEQEELFIILDAVNLKNNSNDSKHNVINTDIAINIVDDMKLIFNQISLEITNLSITLNHTILPIMAFYIVAAEEQGVTPQQLKGSIENDILKEFMEPNRYSSPTHSMKIISNIFEYTNQYMPKFNSINISGHYLHEVNTTVYKELAYMLAQGLEYIKKGLELGLSIDTLASKLSFSWSIGMNHFIDIAKMRAARMLWAKMIKQFNPKNENSLKLRTHCKTAIYSLAEQNSFNNITRTTIQAASAIFGGTQSLHTNIPTQAKDLQTNLSVRIARNTQLFLQEETKVTKTVDPWGGSYYIEKLTQNLTEKAWEHIEEIEAMGGMTMAIKSGIYKSHIKETFNKKQTRIDFNQNITTELNQYKSEKNTSNNIPNVDEQTTLNQQLERLNKIKSERDSEKIKTILSKLTSAVQNGQENLLSLAIDAARERATLNEICKALEV
ncbi:methylmalonyl-CoA mutase family protein [Pseudalgibacter alginicilyticus]|uniref:methylmalonyl-CoA mutase family protein n=1 Tax=Pseudalgibacter alginicilyticus TaxID=1736674 RepID=UPI000AB2D95D